MRAVRTVEYGQPLVVEEIADPVAGHGEVVVDVTRSTVNPLDVWIAAGNVAAAGPLPRTPGGEGVGTLPDGTRVVFRGAGLGLTRDGSYAARVAIPAAIAVPIPDGVADAAAACLGIAGVTALECLELGRVEAGTRVLVLGATGGVANLALQLARARGAHTVAQTSSTARAEALRSQADDVVVSDGAGLEAAVRGVADGGVDVVIDGLAGPFSAPGVRLLARGGRHVLYGASAGQEFGFATAEMYRKKASVLGYSGLADDPVDQARVIARLLGEVAAGRLAPVVADELPLAEAGEAHRRIRANEAGGKLLLVP